MRTFLVKALRSCILLLVALGLMWACPFDVSLREYLDAHFWLPFAKRASNFERTGVRRISAPFAGMVKAQNDTPLDRLRAAYQSIPQPQIYPRTPTGFDPAPQRQALAAARADASLTAKDREEVDLIDAKIDMRLGDAANPEPLQRAKKKLEQFLQTARTPEFLSEARGWLAHVDYLLGDRTSAGKLYLDELNRNGSNLSRETILTSLQMTYGYDGGPDLLAHLEDYFDTPEHAAFAIDLVTNPRWPNYGEAGYEREGYRRPLQPAESTEAYSRVQGLLEKHRSLLQSQPGSRALALLLMRTALRMGDPPGALKIAAMLPSSSPTRSDPDFQWMLASSQFLSHDYAAAEKPLLDLFRSASATGSQKAAARYGLVGVYRELGNPVEEIHYALLKPAPSPGDYADYPSIGVEDLSVYWAESGLDLSLLLDSEAPIDALTRFLAKYPNLDAQQIQLVKYSLAVRLARENKYDESAALYQSIGAAARADRMRDLASLSRKAASTGLSPADLQQAKFKLAEYIASNEDRLFFNDRLWQGIQRYGLYADSDDRLSGAQHQAAVDGERKLRDDQEEYWQAYLILRDLVHDSGKTALGRQAAQLAVRCLRRINQDRFGRQDEIRAADSELSKWLQQP